MGVAIALGSPGHVAHSADLYPEPSCGFFYRWPGRSWIHGRVALRGLSLPGSPPLYAADGADHPIFAVRRVDAARSAARSRAGMGVAAVDCR